MCRGSMARSLLPLFKQHQLILALGNPWLADFTCVRQAALPLMQQGATQQQWQHSVPWQQQVQPASTAATPSRMPSHYTRLLNLTPVPGAARDAIRWGRGNGSGRGNYCGRGIKGQNSRSGGGPHLLYDGGQKQLRKFPKVHVKPSSPVAYQPLHLDRLAAWVRQGRLDGTQLITMKDLRDSGCVAKTIRWGVQLLSRGAGRFDLPLHLQVSAADPAARAAVERAGGSVTTVYYTRLGLRALLKPEAFEKKGRPLPGPVRAWPPRENGKFDAIGQLPPQPVASGAAAAAVGQLEAADAAAGPALPAA